jgi:hypothetical protein
MKESGEEILSKLDPPKDASPKVQKLWSDVLEEIIQAGKTEEFKYERFDEILVKRSKHWENTFNKILSNLGADFRVVIEASEEEIAMEIDRQ